ncbi:uncharacterized protein [Battus philenor]|uniref:uncharacterized protein isoform X2 n=1 Tax=Battus philenor TaxID=42288 RepID=UPI0035D0C9E4
MMSDMETSVRGFSFMPEAEIKIKEIDLQYVEDSELERAWRSSRRERMKQQEQKIWNDFIQEQDIVQSVCESDRYQFIEQLSESCLKELLRSNLNKVHEAREAKIEEKQEASQTVAEYSSQVTPAISIENTGVDQQDDHNVLHIFHDDKDNDDLSGNEGEALNDSSGSPLCTVREKQDEKEEQTPQEPSEEKPPRNCSPEKVSSKFTGSINSVIENSIYCAKVKDLRIRINEEILSIMTSIERLNMFNMDLEELKKIMKRSSEFCSRFSRIHVYQLQRQIHDMSRTNSTQLPFGQHTQLQAHMIRVVSLHQNMLQAFCAFHKSFPQTLCSGDSLQLGATIAQLVRDVPAPAHAAAKDLYSDDLLQTCDKLEEALNDYSARITEFIKNLEENNNRHSKKSNKGKEKLKPANSCKTSSRADGKLSMYSLDTLRINLKAKSATSKKNMAWKQRVGRDVEVRTMVEAVAACASSHVSLVPSADHFPLTSKSMSCRSKVPSSCSKSKESTPRSKRVESSRKNQKCKNKPSTPQTDVKVESCRKSRTSEEAPSEITKSSKDTYPSTMTNDGSESRRSENKYKLPDSGVASAEVTRLLRELCGGDATGNKSDRVCGARNAQLHCISSDSPRQPTTPQLLRILEETIQKKSPRSMNHKLSTKQGAEKYRMPFNIGEKTIENLFQYRTKFVQHMLTSAMYANSAVEKPWEMVNCVSEQIIDDLLLECAKEMELQNIIQHLYQRETK